VQQVQQQAVHAAVMSALGNDRLGSTMFNSSPNQFSAVSGSVGRGVGARASGAAVASDSAAGGATAAAAAAAAAVAGGEGEGEGGTAATKDISELPTGSKKKKKYDTTRKNPKRPLTAYTCFVGQERSQVQAANPNASFKEIATLTGYVCNANLTPKPTPNPNTKP
jgi:hypothetical protein